MSVADLAWEEARARAYATGAAGALPSVRLPLGAVAGLVLAGGLRARTDLPPFDTAAMDGWAVSGPGPWRLVGRYLAGDEAPPLTSGEAVQIATGARLPTGTAAVLRRESGRVDGSHLHGGVEAAQDIRPAGQECRAGDALLPAGTVMNPAAVGLAAAAGYDELDVIRRVRADVLVLGDELLTSGLPQSGRVRDALGPALPGWLASVGAATGAVTYVKDTVTALHDAVLGAKGDVVVTTGGTARGPVDHVHTVLADLGAQLLVDGVAVRPGHPMLLAQLPDGRLVTGLPGNPLAAISGVLTVLTPLLRGLAGRGPGAAATARLGGTVSGHPTNTRLVPVLDGEPLHYAGPAMLRSLAVADGMAVIPPHGAAEGTEVEVLVLPWRTT